MSGLSLLLVLVLPEGFSLCYLVFLSLQKPRLINYILIQSGNSGQRATTWDVPL